MTTLNIIRGDDMSVKITVTRDGVAVDITGYTFFFTAKLNLTDSDTEATIKKDWTTHSDPTHGITYLVLSDTETDVAVGRYVYDIQVKTASGAIQSTSSGICIVSDDVTKRTS